MTGPQWLQGVPKLDAMGHPFSSWLVARMGPDGRAVRDAAGRVIYETQAEASASMNAQINTPAAPVQQELFA